MRRREGVEGVSIWLDRRASGEGEEKTLVTGFRTVRGDALTWAGGILAYDTMITNNAHLEACKLQ